MTRLSVPRDRPEPNIPASVWYPANEPEQQRRDGIYDLSFARDARPAKGSFGLIVISHGSGGSDVNHHDWAEHLARHGYVVAAPRHVGDSHDVAKGLGSREQLLERPRQMKLLVDAVLTHPLLGPSIDPERLGALGFSAGGYTVLTLLGAVPDYSHWNLYCQINPEAELLCPLGTETRPNHPGDADWPSIRDPRIKAAVLLSPFALLFDDAQLARIATPLRVYRAQDETVTLNEWNADRVIANVSGPVESATKPGGHFVFIAPVGETVAQKYPEFYQDTLGIDRAALHREIAGELVTYFGKIFQNRNC